MQPFNLAETRMLERRYCRQYVRKRLQVIGIVAVLTVLVASGSSIARGVIEQKSRQVKTELSGLQMMSARSRRDIQEADMGSLRHSWQQELVGGTRRWMNTLNIIFACTTSDIWLQKMETLEKDSKIIVGGMATSYAALSSFTGHLRSYPEFSEVRIAGVKSSGNQADQSLAFSVEIKLPAAGGGPSLPAQAGTAPAGVPKVPGAM